MSTVWASTLTGLAQAFDHHGGLMLHWLSHSDLLFSLSLALLMSLSLFVALSLSVSLSFFYHASLSLSMSFSLSLPFSFQICLSQSTIQYISLSGFPFISLPLSQPSLSLYEPYLSLSPPAPPLSPSSWAWSGPNHRLAKWLSIFPSRQFSK